MDRLSKGDIMESVSRVFLARQLRNGRAPLDFVDFLTATIRTDGGLYSFDRHGPLLEIARRLPNLTEAWILKGAQVGLSTLAIGWCLYLALGKGYHVGYALPTKIFASRFLKTRFQAVAAGSPLLKAAVRTTANVGVMTLSGPGSGGRERAAHLYLLGMENLTDAISIPLDALIFDEVDVLNQENMDWADDRIAASGYRQKLYFSVGMNPGLGMDAGYQASNQQVWLVRCPACGKDDQVLEELFPGCVLRRGDRWQRVCVACHKPLEVQDQGRWVARYPDRDVAGYRIPQLIIPQISLDYIMIRWQRAQQRRSLLAKFRSSTLALPDAGERQRITAEQLTGVLGEYPTRERADWSVGGADVGDTCHVVFADLAGDRLRFIHLEEVSADRMVEAMSALITDMGCRIFVIDAKPFRSEVRRLARLHPDVVVLQYFKEQSFGTGAETHEGTTYRTVNENREDSLDAYCDLFDHERPGVLFPRYLEGRDFIDSPVAAQHLKGSQKVETMDRRLGKAAPRFRKAVENHYLMACNNARKALVLATQGPGPGGTGALPVFGGL